MNYRITDGGCTKFIHIFAKCQLVFPIKFWFHLQLFNFKNHPCSASRQSRRAMSKSHQLDHSSFLALVFRALSYLSLAILNLQDSRNLFFA